ncbi:sensor histidine kinase [Jatrophihabitans sp. DSM 45814]
MNASTRVSHRVRGRAVTSKDEAPRPDAVDQTALLLIAAVSHDLRTPLAGIKIASSTLSDNQLYLDSDTRISLASLIDLEADRLARLIGDLLDMSRIQAGVLSPQCTVVSPTALVDGALDGLTAQAHDRASRVCLPAALPLIVVDVGLITRVLVNLVENAAKHGAPEAPIAIRAEAGAGLVTFSVSDTGPGVARHQRAKIFEIFTHGGSGTGVGLAIAKAFVEAHGQRIWVDTAPEGGARFSFTAPRAQPSRC